MDGAWEGDAKARCEADASGSGTALVPTVFQVFLGVDGGGTKMLGRNPENQSLLNFFFFANVLSEKGRWRRSYIIRQMLAYYFIHFLKTFFFWCGSLLKFLLSLLQYCFCFMFWCFWALGLWDLSLLTKDRTWPLCIGRWCRNCWNTREAPHLLFWLIHNLLVSRYCPHFTDEGQRG